MKCSVIIFCQKLRQFDIIQNQMHQFLGCKSTKFCRKVITHDLSFKYKAIWASSWENVSSGVSDQVRLKPACSATEASMRFEILVTET